MNKFSLIISFISVISIESFAQNKPIIANNGFTLTSPNLQENGTIQMKHVFDGFGCTGNNISPELNWVNPPEGTKSFALTVYDPDAPTGSGWWHWTVFNIPANIRSLRAGEKFTPIKTKGGIVSFGAVGEGRTDFGKPGYGGPCPPEGDKPHRYIFTIYALKEPKLLLNRDSSGAMVGYTLNANQLGKASITALFGRAAKQETKPKK
jgi:Raf kinase inhibitor-like YbhB/YbcL family protein